MPIKMLKEGATLPLNGLLYKRNAGDPPVLVECTDLQAEQYKAAFEEEKIESITNNVKEEEDAS